MLAATHAVLTRQIPIRDALVTLTRNKVGGAGWVSPSGKIYKVRGSAFNSGGTHGAMIQTLIRKKDREAVEIPNVDEKTGAHDAERAAVAHGWIRYQLQGDPERPSSPVNAFDVKDLRTAKHFIEDLLLNDLLDLDSPLLVADLTQRRALHKGTVGGLLEGRVVSEMLTPGEVLGLYGLHEITMTVPKWGWFVRGEFIEVSRSAKWQTHGDKVKEMVSKNHRLTRGFDLDPDTVGYVEAITYAIEKHGWVRYVLHSDEIALMARNKKEARECLRELWLSGSVHEDDVVFVESPKYKELIPVDSLSAIMERVSNRLTRAKVGMAGWISPSGKIHKVRDTAWWGGVDDPVHMDKINELVEKGEAEAKKIGVTDDMDEFTIMEMAMKRGWVRYLLNAKSKASSAAPDHYFNSGSMYLVRDFIESLVINDLAKMGDVVQADHWETARTLYRGTIKELLS